MAAQQYVTAAEFADQSIPGDATFTLNQNIINGALLWASGVADSYLRKRYTLPLIAFGEDLKSYVSDLAQWRVLARRGFRPGSGTDEVARMRFDDAMAWLKQVSQGTVEVDCTDSTPQVEEDGTLSASGEPAVSWRMTTGPRCLNGINTVCGTCGGYGCDCDG